MKAPDLRGLQPAEAPLPVLAEEAQAEDGSLTGRIFTGETLAEADLSRLSFEHVRFVRCRFPGCDFSRASFTDCAFSSCDLSGCNLQDSYFGRCTLEDVKGVGADLRRAAARHVRLQGCPWQYANLSECRLDTLELRGSSFAGAFFNQCKVKALTADDTDFTRASFFKTPLRGVDLRTCQVGGLIVSDTHFELQGAIVTWAQAAELAALLGLVIR